MFDIYARLLSWRLVSEICGRCELARIIRLTRDAYLTGEPTMKPSVVEASIFVGMKNQLRIYREYFLSTMKHVITAMRYLSDA